MLFEFLSPLSGNYGLMIIIIFILFALAMKQVIKIIKNAVYIVVAAVIFPIVASRLLDIPIKTDAESIISFAVAGLTLYFIYLVAKSIYTVLKYGKTTAKKFMPDFKPGKGEKEGKTEQSEEKEEKIPKPRINNKFYSYQRVKAEKKLNENYIELGDVVHESDKIHHKMDHIKEIKFRKKRKKVR
jgi:hypothetical protein